MRKYNFTPGRRVSLRKAQLASARKRSRNKKAIYAIAGVTVVAAATAGGIYAYKHQVKPTPRVKLTGRPQNKAQRTATIYHITSPESATAIVATRHWNPEGLTGLTWFSNKRGWTERGHRAQGATLQITVPSNMMYKWRGHIKLPNNEMWLSTKSSNLEGIKVTRVHRARRKVN